MLEEAGDLLREAQKHYESQKGEGAEVDCIISRRKMKRERRRGVMDNLSSILC